MTAYFITSRRFSQEFNFGKIAWLTSNDTAREEKDKHRVREEEHQAVKASHLQTPFWPCRLAILSPTIGLRCTTVAVGKAMTTAVTTKHKIQRLKSFPPYFSEAIHIKNLEIYIVKAVYLHCAPKDSENHTLNRHSFSWKCSDLVNHFQFNVQ